MQQGDIAMLAEALAGSFGLPAVDLVSRGQIIAALALRVDRMLESSPDQLFSLLYRLDISERKIKAAMAAEEGVAKRIAVLIYERQLEKIVSRKQFPADRPGDDLAW